MNKHKKMIIIWTKVATATIATIVWVMVIYNILQQEGGFSDQAPVCMFSTMFIFALLTGVYKGLGYWDKSN